MFPSHLTSVTLEIKYSPRNLSKNKTSILSDAILEIDFMKPFEDDYLFIKDLGRVRFIVLLKGVHSNVMLLQSLKTLEYFAVKLFLNAEEENIKNVRFVITKFYKECAIVKGLSHPNIVKISHIFTKNDCYSIFFEYRTSITLKKIIGRIKKSNHLCAIAKIITQQLLTGLNYLNNEMKICHRDLKPDNILVCRKDFHAIITDFGSSFSFSDYKEDWIVSPNGTLEFLPPELKTNSFNIDYYKIDIFSLGVILGLIYTEKTSSEKDFNNAKDFLNANSLKDKCLEENPNLRLLIKDALENEFYKDIGLDEEQIKLLAITFFNKNASLNNSFQSFSSDGLNTNSFTSSSVNL